MTRTTTSPRRQGGVQAASSTPTVKSNPVQGVYVIDKDKSGKLRVKFVPVTTGITGATDIEVLSGLTEGQEIVTGPFKTLRTLKAAHWSSGIRKSRRRRGGNPS